jgi:5-methylcytosine-specific restriction endonuclease McrA
LAERGLSPTQILHQCAWCHADFYPKRTDRRQYCSRQCAFDHKAANSARRKAQAQPKPAATRHQCLDCTAEIVRGLRCLPCSRKRGLEAGRRSYYRRRGDVRCPDCGVPIANDGSYQHRCPDCRAKRQLRNRRIDRQTRKHRERAATVEQFDPLEVLARDGWRCHLCGRRTPEAKRGTYADNAPELDHIIPLAKGGSHSRANTACACRRCNIQKSDRVLGQLSLLSA